MKLRSWALLCCLACSGQSSLATLKQIRGDVERDRAERIDFWEPAALGARFALGDGVRTRREASAALDLDDGAELTLGADTQVRFSATPPPPHIQAFDVQTGSATLQARGAAIAVQTRIGLARVERDSTVILRPSGTSLRFEVQVGRAVFGASEPLLAGAEVLVDATGSIAPPSDEGTGRTALARANLQLADPTGAITAMVRGQGATVRSGESWVPLAEGAAQLASGSELETAAHTSIEIERGGQHAVLGENGRYLLSAGSGVLVKTARGEVVAGGSELVRVEVPGGVIAIAPAGEVELSVGASATTVSARRLDAVIETGDARRVVSAGQSVTLEGGSASAERGAGHPLPDQALDYADVELPSGLSATIHDPTPPTAVRFSAAGACEGPVNVEVLHAGKRLRRGVGVDGVSLSVPPGSHRYELRCGRERGARVRSGQLTVVADAATRSIASKPPTTTLAADGRKYTVLYQNRLPAVSLRWDGAGSARNIRLVHGFAGAETSLSVPAPRHDFGSGELAEGRHSFYFEAGGSISRPTSVDIVFDNAAPRASLSLPPVLEQKPGEPVVVAGTALPGSEIWVEGERVRLDPGGRFSTTTSMPRERRALSIQLVQPRRGTHFYLRRGRPQ
jgi:hypothetical protein